MVVHSGQETPTTDRLPRESLHKEVMSGGSVAARLLAIITKMVSILGVEINETVKSVGVTKATFWSIVRSLAFFLAFFCRSSWLG